MKKYTVDRFEGDVAVLLEKGNEAVQKDVPKRHFPDNISEGDIVEETDKGQLHYRILKEETTHARDKAKDLIEKLKKKNQ